MHKKLYKKIIVFLLIVIVFGLNIIPIINGKIYKNISKTCTYQSKINVNSYYQDEKLILKKNNNFNIEKEKYKIFINYLNKKLKSKRENINIISDDSRTLGAWELFGFAVSISGKNAIVGEVGDNFDTGSAHIFSKIGSKWIKTAKIRNSIFSPFEWFGGSVCINNDYAIVSAPIKNNGTGEAYIFERDGSRWFKKAKLLPSDAKPGYNIGFWNGVSICGDYALVGAPGGVNEFGIETGSAYVFKRNGNTWDEIQKLTASNGKPKDGFGFAVSINYDYAIISSIGNINAPGLAYIFKYNGGLWEEIQILNVSDIVSFDFFGSSVSLDGNYAVVGASGKDNETGVAYVFKRSDSYWVEDAKLVPFDGEEEDSFGWSVAVDGDYIVVGAYGDDDHNGSAYIYRNIESNWEFDDKLLPLDIDENSEFGWSVSIDGDYVCIGAPWGKGASYIFKRYDSGWSLDQRLTYQKSRTKNNFVCNILTKGIYKVNKILENILLLSFLERFPILQKILNFLIIQNLLFCL